MMIRTNLMWEVQEKGRPEPRNVILAILVPAVLIASAAYWFMLDREAKTSAGRLAEVTRKTEARTRELAALKESVAAKAAHATRRDQIVRYGRNRLLWAPILERLFAAVPTNVEINSMSLSCAGQEDCRVIISGTAAGTQPRLECDRLRLLLVQSLNGITPELRADFDQLEDTARIIKWENQDFPAANFTIRISWKHSAHGS